MLVGQSESDFSSETLLTGWGTLHLLQNRSRLLKAVLGELKCK